MRRGDLGAAGSLAFVGEDEVVEADLLGHASGRREEVDEELSKMIGANAVEVVFSFTSRFDQTGDAQEREVVADRGLALTETIAQLSDVHLLVLGEVKEDAEPRFVAEELEDLGELTNDLIGNLGHSRRGLSGAFVRSLDHFLGHGIFTCGKGDATSTRPRQRTPKQGRRRGEIRPKTRGGFA